jgi:hypothetical protein
LEFRIVFVLKTPWTKFIMAVNHMWSLGPWSSSMDQVAMASQGACQSSAPEHSGVPTLAVRARGGRGRRAELTDGVGNQRGGGFGWSLENGGGGDFGAPQRGTQKGRNENIWWKQWQWGEARAWIPFTSVEGREAGGPGRQFGGQWRRWVSMQ